MIGNVGDTANFTFIVTNTGNVELSNVVVIDDNETPGDLSDDFAPAPVLTNDGFNVGDLDKDNKLDLTEAWRYTASKTVTAGLHTNLATATGTSPQGQKVTDDDPANWTGKFDAGVDIEKYVKKVGDSTGGTEGLTPGYWKQSHHFDDWTGYSPNMNYNAVFGVNDSSSLTLLGALGRGGGEKAALGRHAVAALLNAAHSGLDYAFTEAQVIAMVQQAYANGSFESVKNILAAENEKEGSLSGGGSGGSTGIGSDADTEATGVTVKVGEQVMFTYLVKNTGDVELNNVIVKDDNATPGNTADDFMPAPVLSGGFNIGDTDKDGKLDVSETWHYTAMLTATTEGKFVNDAVVTGEAFGTTVTDNDVAHICVIDPDPCTSVISGYVYEDCDNDGVKDSGEKGIQSVKMVLTGTDKDGNSVTKTTYTDCYGKYEFKGLCAGTYKVTECQPGGYLDGKDTVGSAGGVLGADMIASIALGKNQTSTNNNFGELEKSSLSGYVYEDKDNDGKKDSGEKGIQNVKIILTGTNDLGQTVNMVTYTDCYGKYSFECLRPGTYAIQECQPSNYNDGIDTLGSLGGTKQNDKFINIVLGACKNGTGYNFGERAKSYWC